MNQGPPDYKSSALNHSATPPPRRHGYRHTTRHRLRWTIFTGKKFRRSYQDVRVNRGADHYLAVACLKLKLKKNWTGATPQRNRYDTGHLTRCTKLEEYRVTIRNKYQMLQELMEDEETVNSRKTRAEKSKAQEEYSNTNKRAKKSIRADKRKYIDGLVEEAEQAARVGNTKDGLVRHHQEVVRKIQ